MTPQDTFSKRFLTICMGVSAVMLSAAALIYSIQPSQAAEKVIPVRSYQVGTAENYIPLGISNGYAYWIVYNVSDGYKFRKANISAAKWEEK